MPRPSRFSDAQILDATAAIVAADGPSAATIGAIGHMLKAPSGSIYHRFASRDVLLGRLWLRKAAFFQDRFAAALADPDPFKAGLAAALSMPRAVREDFAGARIMLLHRRDGFLDGDWPLEMACEAIRLKQQVDDAMNEIARRLFGRVSAEALRLVNFAIIDVPFAAVRRHVAVNELPPRSLEELIARTYAALIAPARRPAGGQEVAERGSESPQVRRRKCRQRQRSPNVNVWYPRSRPKSSRRKHTRLSTRRDPNGLWAALSPSRSSRRIAPTWGTSTRKARYRWADYSSMTPAAGLPWCVPKAAARQWRCSLPTRPSGKVFSPASCAAATRCLTGRKTWVRHGRRCAPTSVPSGPCSRLWTTAMARASAPATMKISRSTKRRAFPMAATIAGSRAHCATARDFERPGIASSRTRRAALILASLPMVITWWCCGNTRSKTSRRVTDSNSPPSASTAWRMRRSPTRACSTSTPLRCYVSSNATSSVPRRMRRRTCDDQPGACGHVSPTQPFPDREHAVCESYWFIGSASGAILRPTQR